jgi:hypothetical protein
MSAIATAIIHWASSSISLLSTSCLFYLIIKKSPKELRQYRWLLFYVSAMDAATTLVFLLADFDVVVLDSPVLIGPLLMIKKLLTSIIRYKNWN